MGKSKQNRLVRVVECGGQGARRVDICGKTAMNLATMSWPPSPIIVPPLNILKAFAKENIPVGTEAVIYSVAGVVENHAKVISCPNIHFLNGEKLGNTDKKDSDELPTFVCNDAEAFITGMAEIFPNLNYFMGITWSTGIGVRIWKDGKILSDSEGGHMRIDNSPFAPVCGCGLRGCAEALISGSAVTKFVIGEMAAQHRTIPDDMHPCAWLDHCFGREDEPWAARHYGQVIIPGMAAFLANIQTLLHLPAIVWKGTFGLRAFKNLPGLGNYIRAGMKERMMNPAWVDDLTFFLLNCEKDHDSYLGAATIAEKLLNQQRLLRK